jgi:hypothetical protein
VEEIYCKFKNKSTVMSNINSTGDYIFGGQQVDPDPDMSPGVKFDRFSDSSVSVAMGDQFHSQFLVNAWALRRRIREHGKNSHIISHRRGTRNICAHFSPAKGRKASSICKEYYGIIIIPRQ